MSDTLRALADDCCEEIEAYGGPAALSAGIEAGELIALAVVEAVDVRADRLGASAADVNHGTARGRNSPRHPGDNPLRRRVERPPQSKSADY